MGKCAGVADADADADADATVLFHNYQVYGATTAEIRALVDGVEYAFAVDAVNENGVTLGDAAVFA